MEGAIQRADLTLRRHGEHRVAGDDRVANHIAFRPELVQVGLPAKALDRRRIRRRADDERAAAELFLRTGYGLAKDVRESRGQFVADRLRGARLSLHHDLSDGAPVFFGRCVTRRCIAKPKPVAVFCGLGLRRRVTSDQSSHAGQTGRHEVPAGKFQLGNASSRTWFTGRPNRNSMGAPTVQLFDRVKNAKTPSRSP